MITVASKERAEQWLTREAEKAIAGEIFLVPPSGESHYTVTERNVAVSELETKQGTIVHRLSCSVPW